MTWRGLAALVFALALAGLLAVSRGGAPGVGGTAPLAAERTVHGLPATPEVRRHILYGDSRGGGHKAGVGAQGKSEFPAHWSDSRIIDEVERIAADPAIPSVPSRGRYLKEGRVDGVDIRVVLEEDGRIVTAYPTNRARNR